MPNLKFKQLLILSDSTKSANLFEFNDHFNLITANDNSVGKSTLVKLLFWGLGCEPLFDTKWAGLDCKVLVRFKIEKSRFEIIRYKDLVSIKENDSERIQYSKITGDFAKKMSEILGFKALLPSRKTEDLECPPPAYYFLPFYIDQVKSWSTAWNNFEKLGQYDSWKSTIIKYHVGLLTPSHFELDVKKKEKKVAIQQIEKYNTAIDIIQDYTPSVPLTAISPDKFEAMTNEIRLDLNKLTNEQEKALEEFAIIESEIVYLEHQKNITLKIISELDKDYIFTIENICDDIIECPLCGVVHENSVINRTSILTDKIQAENQLESINRDLKILFERKKKTTINFERIHHSINEINEKYIISDNESVTNLSDIIENIAGTTIKNNVVECRKVYLNEEVELKKKIKIIQKELKEILSDADKKEINSDFIAIFSSYIKTLNAEAVNLSKIKTPLDYNLVIKEGGAAEGARAILAYYLTIFTMVEKYGHEVVSPLVIDTPNQQEQSHMNYDQIVDLVTNKLSKSSQVFICAMENPLLKPYMEKATIIRLDSGKLLCEHKYHAIKDEFELK